jgi:hypothetical protein
MAPTAQGRYLFPCRGTMEVISEHYSERKCGGSRIVGAWVLTRQILSALPVPAWILYCYKIAIFLLAILGLKSKVNTWVLPHALLTLGCFSDIVGVGHNPPTYASHVAGILDIPHHTWLFFLKGGLTNFLCGWPQTTVLPISAFQVAGVTAVSHQHLALILLFLISTTFLVPEDTKTYRD